MFFIERHWRSFFDIQTAVAAITLPNAIINLKVLKFTFFFHLGNDGRSTDTTIDLSSFLFISLWPLQNFKTCYLKKMTIY
jgi:hypothetical protein